MTDTLQATAGNTSRFAGGSYIEARFATAAYTQPETRTGEEVKAHIVGKLKALGGGS